MTQIRQPELGYYDVGGKLYLSKIAALIDGTATNTHVEWRFNDEIFNKVDWTVEPTESLIELYAQRARQIREKYKYLILSYSGGSDSDNILQVFIRNNIKLDEVLFHRPVGLNYKPNTVDKTPTNLLSEWDFTVKPKLEKLANDHPEIKITIRDWCKDIDSIQIDDEFILNRSNFFAPYIETRWDLSKCKSFQDTLLKIDSVGVILGNDKPRICYRDSQFKLYFLDISTTHAGSRISTNLEYAASEEFFYWNPDCVKLIAKQAHMVAAYFKSTPQLTKFIAWPHSREYKVFYDSVVRNIVYPYWDSSDFQVSKLLIMRLGLDRTLFEGDASPHQKNIIRLYNIATDVFTNKIDKKYLQYYDGEVTITGMISNMWPIK